MCMRIWYSFRVRVTFIVMFRVTVSVALGLELVLWSVLCLG